jgi:hypothetical protein
LFNRIIERRKMLRRHEISKEISTAATWDRKVSVPISMPQSLLEDIDRARGEIARSPFVCKILRAHIINVKTTGDSHANAGKNNN